MRILHLGSKKEAVSVTKQWTHKLSWKMQAVLLQGLRAPDTHYCFNLKIVSRWLRSVVYNNADKDHTFMCIKEEMPVVEILDNELNYCSMHFATHFLYALEIVAYEHPEKEIRDTAFRIYRGVVEDLSHFKVEPKNQMRVRLADVEEKIEDEVKVVCPPVREDPYLA